MGKVEPTTKQKKTADILIEQQIKGENLNRGKAMEEAGYSESMQKTPTAVTKSVGFLAYMEDAGITEQNLATMLAEDLSGKPKERLGEMKLAAQLMGIDGASDSGASVQVNVMFEKMREMIDAEVIDDKE